MRKFTLNDFIKRANEVHKGKYIYTESEYIDANTKLKVICPEHGEFWIRPSNHINLKQGCPKCGLIQCANTHRHSLEEFIEKANEIHKGKYIYTESEYKTCDTKLKIICPEHGEFWQTPYHHLNGNGCPKCYRTILKTTEQFIDDARKVHGNKYIYTSSVYIGANKPIDIECPIHGIFTTTPSRHVNNKCGCPKCKGKNKTTKSIIEEFRKIHGDQYIYTDVIYSGAFTDVKIKCPIHGDFWQTPHSHLRGCGCPKCANDNINKYRQLEAKTLFEEKANKVHGNKYTYHNDYIDSQTKIKITCPIHGEFWQTPNKHLMGNGCPKCKETSLERDIRIMLDNNNIEYQYNIVVKNIASYRADFYLPKQSIVIECQGIQHFKNEPFFKTYDFEKRKQMDIDKFLLYEKNNLNVIYYTSKEIYKLIDFKESPIYNQENVFTTADDVLNYIKNSSVI